MGHCLAGISSPTTLVGPVVDEKYPSRSLARPALEVANV